MTGKGWELLAGAAVVMVAAYVWRAIFRPSALCSWCHGSGRVGTGRRWRNCTWCDGSGRRMTWGARLIRGQVRFRAGRWGR